MKLLTTGDLAELLATSIRTVHRLNSSGMIPKPLYVGRRPRWRRDEILAWIESGCPDRQHWVHPTPEKGDQA